MARCRAWIAIPLAVGACAPEAGSPLTLVVDSLSVPADGTSRARAVAACGALGPSSVVSFELVGPGLLSTTQVRAAGGEATVEVWAPFEDDLTAGAGTATLTARTLIDAVPLEASAPLAFTMPTGGAPALRLRASPDRVRAGGTDPITLIIEGRRLGDTTVTLTADSDVIELPALVALTGDGPLATAEVLIAAPSVPAEVTVTVNGGGAPPASATLRFVAEGEATFDLNGTFAQASYGVMQLGGLFFLDPNPQCLVAKSYSLVRMTHQGSDLTMTMEVCDLVMPDVTVVLVGASETWVEQGFIDAMNAHAPTPQPFPVGADGSFAPDLAGAPAIVIGAELADPNDPLPTEGDDPRVRDDDGDGNPGVTIHNSAQGEQYSASRTRVTSLVGQVVDSDAIDGEQSAVGESSLFNGSGGLSPEIENFPAPFHLRRVDGRNGAPNIAGRDGDAGSISCADVIAFTSELAVLAPPPRAADACE